MSPTVAAMPTATTAFPPRQRPGYLTEKGRPLATVTDSPTPLIQKHNVPQDEAPEKEAPLPYWLTNIPRSQWPPSCPSYLRDISQKNIEILSTPDHLYQRQGWDLVTELVRMCVAIVESRIHDAVACHWQTTANLKTPGNNGRHEPNRPLPAPPQRSPPVPGVQGADRRRVRVDHALRRQGAIAVGGRLAE